jgi:Fe-S cluster assembly protein SufD
VTSPQAAPALADASRPTAGAWLGQRERAFDLAVRAPFPTVDLEEWRYSRIAELSLGDFTPAATPTTVEGGSGATIGVFGREFVGTTPEVDLAPVADDDLFGLLNLAHMDVVLVEVPAGSIVSEPIVVTHRLDGAGRAFFPRLVIRAGRDSEVTVIERFVSPDGVRLLVVPVLDLRAEQAARVRYVAVNQLGDAAWQIGHQGSVGERDSDSLLASVALGGDYARTSTAARLLGIGGNTRQVALYFAGDSQMHDFRTLQDHKAPRTTSDLLFKGAVQDTAKSVYTGLIRIGNEAKGSAAYQTNRNLTLSQGAWAESVPNLEIENNDVKCSHASTVGPIDDDQLFYLESRGVKPDVAQRLVVLGFFDEVLAQLPVGGLARELREQVSVKLSIGGAS